MMSPPKEPAKFNLAGEFKKFERRLTKMAIDISAIPQTVEIPIKKKAKGHKF